MKKLLFGAFALMAAVSFVSCDSNDDPVGTGDKPGSSISKDRFLQYAEGVAYDLKETTKNLSESWEVANGNYVTEFTTIGKKYDNQQAALMEIVAGITTIATEVSGEKIGVPYKDKDVYGVESWYSFNSWTDYRDNIFSIQNSFYGKVLTQDATSRASLTSAAADANSLYTYLLNAGDNQQAEKANAVNDAINAAIAKLNQFVAGSKPFRDYVYEYAKGGAESSDVKESMALIDEIITTFEELKFEASTDDAQEVINTYANQVVLPTYAALKSKGAALYDAVKKFVNDPTQANIEAAATAWVAARVPWEQSEAFLFGPVDTEGYDPRLDSWPLAQLNINIILLSDKALPSFAVMGDEFGDEVIGFHTMEYILFKNGAPRKVSELFKGDKVVIEATNEMEVPGK